MQIGSDSVDLGWGLWFCMSNKLPVAVAAVGLWAPRKYQLKKIRLRKVCVHILSTTQFREDLFKLQHLELCKKMTVTFSKTCLNTNLFWPPYPDSLS